MKRLLTLIGIELIILTGCTKDMTEDSSPQDGDNVYSQLTLQSIFGDEAEWITLSNGTKVIKTTDGYVWQGDILLTQKQLSVLENSNTRSIILKNPARRWPDNIIPYEIAATQYTRPIQQAIAYWENTTPVKFIERTDEENYVKFGTVAKGPALSALGMIGGMQEINLSAVISSSDHSQFTECIHLIGHTLGLQNEYARPDRDNYINVSSNIPTAYKDIFNKVSASQYTNVTEFDYKSIMMYFNERILWGVYYNPAIHNAFTDKANKPITKTTSFSEGDLKGIMALCGEPIKDWDWTDPASYDFAYIGGVGQIPISSPFSTQSSSNKDLDLIIKGKDYLPSQGWVLLQKVFGSPLQHIETRYPHFILYNKYRGIIRLFVYNQSGLQHQKAVVTFNWTGSEKTSLLTFSNIIAFPDDEYRKQNIDDKFLNFVDDYYTSAWFVTEFPVSFDHNLNPRGDYSLEFKVFSNVESDIELNASFQMDTKSMSMGGAGREKNIDVGTIYSTVNKTNTFLHKIPDEKTMKQHLETLVPQTEKGEDIQTGIEETNARAREALANGAFAEGLTNIAKAASYIRGPIGFVTSLLELFISKPSNVGLQTVKIAPTVSNGTIKAYGTIEVNTNAARYALQLPGSNHRYGDGTINQNGLPVYDYPLGVFSLESAPQVLSEPEGTTITITVAAPNKPGEVEREVHISRPKYTLRSPIRLAMNGKCGLRLLDGTAQWVLKSQPFPNRGMSPTQEWHYGDTKGPMIIVVDDTTRMTPPVPISLFNRTSINGIGKLYLKLNLVFEPTDDYAEKTPVVFSVMYPMNNIIYASSSASETGSLQAAGSATDCSLPNSGCEPFSPLVITTYNYDQPEQAL